MANYETMTGPQLVVAFNAMLESKEGQQIAANRPGLKPVQRFADHEAGVKRCEMLASSIRAVQNIGKEEEEPEAVAPNKAKAKAKGRTPNGVKTNRQKFKEFLLSKLGQTVTTAQLIKKVYDSDDVGEFKGALNMVVKGFISVNLEKDADLKGLKLEKGKGEYRLFKA